MTPDQAVQKLKALLDDSMSDVKPPLKYWDAWPNSTEQDGGYATASQDRYIMTKVSKAKFGALLGLLERSWKAKGYHIARVNPNQPAMFADTPDGSSISLTVGAADNIAFEASVSPIPVIRGRDPFGTPTPQPTMSNGNPDMIPKYDDPFWSSDQPAPTPTSSR
ncbi:hypothetical protein E6W39_23720 [Kitasatospora acidiphila]|uniref:Uncharacterized protein n=1 Tax=Kitasatospora acidiphila TaxID=2567942 RepID=A0A540W6P2_9ACTN|nr:hypothetical protein [Kitasatospora acidiphila]TQF04680.1 hypothetical protein E6W39_23720 [Kitasatospora acidiphila]